MMRRKDILEVFRMQQQADNMDGVSPYYGGYIDGFMTEHDVFKYAVLKMPPHVTPTDEDELNFIRVHVEFAQLGALTEANINNWIKNQTSGIYSYINVALCDIEKARYIISKIPDDVIIGGWVHNCPIVVKGRKEW